MDYCDTVYCDMLCVYVFPLSMCMGYVGEWKKLYCVICVLCYTMYISVFCAMFSSQAHMALFGPVCCVFVPKIGRCGTVWACVLFM